MIAPLLLVTACGADAPGGGATGSPGPYFENTMFWNRDVSAEPKADNSDQLIGALRTAGGWGNQDHFRVDFSIDVLNADSSAPQTFTPTDSTDFRLCSIDPSRSVISTCSRSLRELRLRSWIRVICSCNSLTRTFSRP